MTSEQAEYFKDYLIENQLAPIVDGEIISNFAGNSEDAVVSTEKLLSVVPEQKIATQEITVTTQKKPQPSSPTPKKVNKAPKIPVKPEDAIIGIREGSSWNDFANCKDTPDFKSKKEEVAKLICKRCPVIKQCLKDGFRLNDTSSVRGGLYGTDLRKEYSKLREEKLLESKAKAKAIQELKAREAVIRDLQYGR